MNFGTWDWVAHYASTQPNAPALRNLENGETRTWRELDERVGKIAHLLLNEWALKPGSRIANLSNGDLRHFDMQFACIRAGMIWVPLNFRQTVLELSALCRNLMPAVMLADAAWSDAAAGVVAEADIPRSLLWGQGEAFDIAIEAAPCLSACDHMIDPHVPMQILFTSGTTGEPKAVAYTLSGLTFQVLNQLEFCATQAADNHIYVPIPLFHAGGLHAFANPILFAGGQVTVSTRFVPETAVSFVGDPANHVTHLSLVPVMYQMMAECAAFPDADFSQVQRFSCAGGRLTQSLLDAYGKKGVSFMTQYGGTETGPTVTSMNPSRIDKIVAGSCGQKARFIDVKLVDDAGEDVPAGEPGEVWVRGPSITAGYMIGGELQPVDGWLKTGDIAICDDEGFFFIVDRVKDMYKSGGENVFPAEVERVLGEHPAVAEVAVIGVADDRWGEVGLAVAIARPGSTLSLEDLRAHCDGKIARFKQPHHLMLVDALPRNVTGKISKQELRVQFAGSKSA